MPRGIPKAGRQKSRWNSNLTSTKEWQDKTRAKIRAGMLIERLAGCAAGEFEMSTAAVSAAKCLLDRVLPSLSSSDITQIPQAQTDYNSLVEQLASLAGPELARQLLDRLAGKADNAKPAIPDAIRAGSIPIGTA